MGVLGKYFGKKEPEEKSTYQEGSAEYERAKAAREERWRKADEEHRAAFKGKGTEQQYSVGEVGHGHSEDLKQTGAPLQRHTERHKYEPPEKPQRQTGQLSPKQKAQSRQSLTPKQQLALARLQVKSQQLASKERRSQAAQARYYASHQPANPNNFYGFDQNVANGVQRSVQGIHDLTNSINRYNDNIGKFDINFANAVDGKTLNGLADFDSRLSDYDKRISRLFLKF